MHVIEGASIEQLLFHLTNSMRSVSEVASHISFDRIEWFEHMDAPSCWELTRQAGALQSPVSINSDRDCNTTLAGCLLANDRPDPEQLDYNRPA